MAFTYEYPRMRTTADLVIFDRSSPRQVLLIKRGNEPHKGRWALPGGHVDMDETFETAARREALEEVGLSIADLTPIGHFDAIDRDPAARTMTVAFKTTIDNRAPVAGDDAAEARWFPAHDLPQNIAFDHRDILAVAIASG